MSDGERNQKVRKPTPNRPDQATSDLIARSFSQNRPSKHKRPLDNSAAHSFLEKRSKLEEQVEKMLNCQQQK
jgi:hypothetical protein